jgi:predicted DNA-binding antitoxin AbrB/MazE fold protein
MVRHIDAIFSQGAFRPVEPLELPEGTRVHLSVEEQTSTLPFEQPARIRSPRLANPKDAADFVLEVREEPNAGL